MEPVLLRVKKDYFLAAGAAAGTTAGMKAAKGLAMLVI
jgi:hypothetical protein